MITLLVAAGLVGGGIYFLRKKEAEVPEKKTPETPETPETPPVEKKPNMVSNPVVFETNNVYGFAERRVELEAGKVYCFTAEGHSNKSANDIDQHLVCFIFKDDWSEAANVIIEELHDTVRSVLFTPQTTGEYVIHSYPLNPDIPTGEMHELAAKGVLGEVTILQYKVEEGDTFTGF